MDGIEYVLRGADEPRLFIIQKQERSRAGVRPLDVYYILDGTVFVAPHVLRVLASSADRSRYCARKALQCFREHASFSADGTRWDYDVNTDNVPKVHRDRRFASEFALGICSLPLCAWRHSLTPNMASLLVACFHYESFLAVIVHRCVCVFV